MTYLILQSGFKGFWFLQKIYLGFAIFSLKPSTELFWIEWRVFSKIWFHDWRKYVNATFIVFTGWSQVDQERIQYLVIKLKVWSNANDLSREIKRHCVVNSIRFPMSFKVYAQQCHLKNDECETLIRNSPMAVWYCVTWNKRYWIVSTLC